MHKTVGFNATFLFGNKFMYINTFYVFKQKAFDKKKKNINKPAFSLMCPNIWPVLYKAAL